MKNEPQGPDRWVLLALAAGCAIATTVAAWQAKAEGPGPQSTPAATASTAPAAKRSLPYDETADPQRDLQTALTAARKTGRRVLVVFGANWCPDCRALDREFHAGGKTEGLVERRYEVVKVDVGRFDRNLDFAKLYGEPIAKGIPSVVIVTPTNTVVYQTRAGELADARALGADGIYDFFEDKADRPAGS